MQLRTFSLWNKQNSIPKALPPEVDDRGNIEYKLKLVNPTEDRLAHLITQLNWRLAEGNGEALYELGVEDNGTLVGLTTKELAATMGTLKRMAEVLDADALIQHEVPVKGGRKVVEALVRRRPSQMSTDRVLDIRIAILGSQGEGKSTLLGCLTQGRLDNGRGRARLALLRHRHEIETGTTSSISHEIIGIDPDGQLINYGVDDIDTWEDICENSAKVVTFLDLCGYAKYLRTTISGMTGYAPHYACLVVSGDRDAIPLMTREHFSLADMLHVPVFVVITKVDRVSDRQVKKVLHLLEDTTHRSVRRIQCAEDLPGASESLMKGQDPIPVFTVSNTNGLHMNLLSQFFGFLTKPDHANHDEWLQYPVEFQVEEVYFLEDTGHVVSGVLRRGHISLKSPPQSGYYHLGPDAKGEFVKVKVTSVHRHRVSVSEIVCGQAATLALSSDELDHWRIHKGMALLATETPESFYAFEAEIEVLQCATTGLTAGACGMLRSGSVRQRARIVSALSPKDTIIKGERGKCVFRFLYGPEYLCVGARLLFLEGDTKCMGRVTRLIRTID